MAFSCIKCCTSLSTFVFLFLIFPQSSSFFPATRSLDNVTTVYEVLRYYNFPRGLLPKGVLGYGLDANTGKFYACLNDSCSFSVEGSYQLKYKPLIRGYISKGRLSRLEGVSVKLFFMWVDIIDVLRSGDDIEFSVGITGAVFPIDNFEESPQCGCGLDCDDNEKLIKLRKKPFASSYL